MDDRVPGYKKIAGKYKQFNKEMRDLWESYTLIDTYSSDLHNLLNKGEISPLKYSPLYVKNEKVYTKSDTQGALHKLSKKLNPRRTLIDAIATFENHISEIVEIVYLDFPEKLANVDNSYNVKQEIKLTRIILESENKEEILDKLVEEKIRSVFYGKPTDLFLKDKMKLGFGDFFRTKFENQIDQFAEISASRNVIIHNGGKVDRKYLREVKNSTYKLNQTIKLSPKYILESITLLDMLGAATGGLVIKNLYNQTPFRGNIGRTWKTINSIVK